MEYTKNRGSFISRKQVADLEDYIDYDIVRVQTPGSTNNNNSNNNNSNNGNQVKSMEINDNNHECKVDNPMKAVFAVTDIQEEWKNVLQANYLDLISYFWHECIEH